MVRLLQWVGSRLESMKKQIVEVAGQRLHQTMVAAEVGIGAAL